MPHPPLLTPVFIDALIFAAQLHLHQERKGTKIPYLSHILAVGAIVLEHCEIEDEAIAALLHDAVEDQGGKPVLERIRLRFGNTVARIVEECTDADVLPKPPWKERKVQYIEHLKTASASARLVSAADKLHNVRTILTDYRECKEDLWGRFNGGREGTLWYYRAVVNCLREAGTNEVVEELDRNVTMIEALARESVPSPV